MFNFVDVLAISRRPLLVGRTPLSQPFTVFVPSGVVRDVAEVAMDGPPLCGHGAWYWYNHHHDKKE